MSFNYTITKRFDKEIIEVSYRKAKSPYSPEARYSGFQPGTTILKKDTIISPGAKPLCCDILFERDVGVKLRDGTTIYVDIFRPPDLKQLPALVAWSPYGKQQGTSTLNDFFMRAGVPKKVLSGLNKFEGPDPDYWCGHGYAVVNPDTRGVFSSEGNIPFWGKQEAEDGYDLIEWVAGQEWSNGNVGMTGNSWLAIMQWFIAAENPPHLKAIAPWEGVTDLYREDIARGGIINTAFCRRVIYRLAGNNYVEDIPEMIRKYPLMNAYWEDKQAKLEKIKIPAYIVASWTNTLHTPGSFTGFRRIKSAMKWLRVHNAHEWPDYYMPENVEDLRKFFDRYLKGIRNGWEKTPKVRLSILNPGGNDMVNLPLKDFPIPGTKYIKLFLNANSRKLMEVSSPLESKIRYIADDKQSKISFTYRFDRYTELAGYLKLRLWVEAMGSNDMDIYVIVKKLDADMHPLPIMMIKPEDVGQYETVLKMYRDNSPQVTWLFSSGASGQIRVSRRALDKKRSTFYEPYLEHRRELCLRNGEIVPVEISITPMGIAFNKDEYLCLEIAGFKLTATPVPLQQEEVEPSPNKGEHVIHTGGRYDSYLLIPRINI